MKRMDDIDINNTLERYNKRLKEFGYSPKSLGWLKGKQDIRFDILTSLYNFDNKSILDIGCGFGDLNKTLKHKAVNYTYLGIDLCEKLVEIGKKQFLSDNIKFQVGDYLDLTLVTNFDWAIESGIFNHKLANLDNYDFIKSTMEKTFNIVKDGFSFDFNNNKVDYEDDHLFYASPEKILSFAYELSRNVVLRSDYMPFEFSIFVFKDDSFDKSDTLFKKYKNDKNI